MDALGLRERKKQATRRALQHEALRLAAEDGLENVTVEGIAAAADVSARTFFNYFSSKEEALVGDGPPQPGPEAMRIFAEGGPTGETVEDLKLLLTSPFEEYAPSIEEVRWRKELMARYPELLRPQFMTAFIETERAIAVAVAERTGDDPDAVRPQLTAAVGTAAMRFSMRRWVCNGGRGELHGILAETFDVLKQGI
ncbi:AcrR family transcriptional regulator [Spinactinospora alkalitolerans]|uniref:AcrR family transcriptional regulator n=1 Tax=Spinactinospora alkalitolerans TaxID=687207 RepID=A0A852TS00_9ACTN|nr:TetR family transcriptional regulator [Spinactinospora alkalitolerans]NYE46325.1 AcrR family transcriptional regulator [Spinactinospora alkalitolerans]